MLSEPCPRKTISVRIFCLVFLFGLTSFANASETMKPDCVLCGHIKDAQTGQPISDAIVYATDGYVTAVQTDKNGFYCFEKVHQDSECRIAIDSNEYVGIYDNVEMPVVKLIKGRQVVKDFNLNSACIIEVQVVDEANQPVEGAELKVTSLGSAGRRTNSTGFLQKHTDKNGLVLLGGIPPSETPYLIIATSGKDVIKSVVRLSQRSLDAPVSGRFVMGGKDKEFLGVYQLQSDYAPGKLTTILDDTNAIVSEKITLWKGVDVNGYAEYEDGVPAIGLTIEVWTDWCGIRQSYRVDANGSFTLRHIVTDRYNIQANIPREKGRIEGIILSQHSLPLPDNEPLVLTIPGKSPQEDVSIRGSLIFTGNKIPEEVDILALANNGGGSTRLFNHGGDAFDTNFTIDHLKPGKYRIAFRGIGVDLKVLEDIIAPCEGLEVELACNEIPYLKGMVLDSKTGKPVRNFKAKAKRIQAVSQFFNFGQPDKWIDFNNSDGSFNIKTVGRGIYQVQVAAENFVLTCSEDINTDQNVPVVIKLSSGGGIKGKVVNETGQPVNGVKVLLIPKPGETMSPLVHRQDPFVSEHSVVVKEDGAFEFEYLTAGTENIKVTHPDYACSLVRDIEIKKGQTTEGIEVVLNKGGIAEGFVFDAQGRPKANAVLDFQYLYRSWDDKVNLLAEMTTDENGYYRVEGLPEEPLIVDRPAEWNGIGVISRMFVPAKGKVSRIDFGGKLNVKGQIIIDGNPLANRKIMLSMIDGPYYSVLSCYAVTENDGTFTFSGIPDGKWAVFYDDNEKYRNWIKAAIFELAGQPVDLGVIPAELATARISIEYEQGMAKWDIEKAYLKVENNLWGQLEKEKTLPCDEKETYIAKGILPGDYCLFLMRKDYSTLRYPIKVEPGDSIIKITIPNYTAGIYGRSISKISSWQTVWSEDKTFVSEIKPDENNNYKLENLPAGKYLLGSNMLSGSTSLFEFELMQGEQKVIDIEVPEILPNQMGVLQVNVLDENGVPIAEAQIWLQGSPGIIEPASNIGGGFYFVAEPQTYTLHANFAGYKEFEQQIQVKDPTTLKSRPKPILVRLEK